MQEVQPLPEMSPETGGVSRGRERYPSFFHQYPTLAEPRKENAHMETSETEYTGVTPILMQEREEQRKSRKRARDGFENKPGTCTPRNKQPEFKDLREREPLLRTLL